MQPSQFSFFFNSDMDENSEDIYNMIFWGGDLVFNDLAQCMK